ncbi:MAG: hypothetical protein ACJA0C_000569 [Candidatus Endobugula sp.]|jgi:hypothetical protein
MAKEAFTLSHRELNRLAPAESIIAKRITQHKPPFNSGLVRVR